ncbi:transglutaminase-like domain-containing protein [Actinoplanes sp. NPDC026670]|uniref:transglutaminase-like domain-containing protein n=1 Tax=Actinoplanes sp. NPDC026670 TaxID=3154700 RepID=UPI0033F65267
MTATIDYTAGGPLTDLSSVRRGALADLPEDPIAIAGLVHRLVIQPDDAGRLGLPPGRFDENQIRPAARLVTTLLGLDPSPLTVPRPPERRVVGTCRHFAVLACALLRHQGIAARARCGFATYFQPGLGLDHWVIEFSTDGEPWVRADPEAMGLTVLATPEALAPGQFLTGGEAWAEFRADRIDAAKFGVWGTENFGPGEIRGNAIRDLASLNRVETLPWDEWGRMDDSYQGHTGADYDTLLDTVAATCAADDPAEVAALYRTEDLEVPPALIA